MKENNLIQELIDEENFDEKKEYYDKINKFISEKMYSEYRENVDNMNNYIIKAFNDFDYGDIEILNIQEDNRDESLKKYNNKEIWIFRIKE